jgi:hypothetical protein
MIEELKSDEQYLAFKRIVSTVFRSMNIDENLKEAEFLHKSRKSRTLHSRKMQVTDLQEAILNDMGNRSRLVEIRTLLTRQQELLSTAISTIRRHIKVFHKEALSEEAPKALDKTAYIDNLIDKPLRMQSRIDWATSIIDTYVKDIDQTGYSLKSSVDLIKFILDRREA